MAPEISTELESRYPLFRFCYALLQEIPFAVRGIDLSWKKYGTDFLDAAEDHLRRLFDMLGQDRERLRRALDSYARLNIDVLRMQNRFFSSGRPAPWPPADRLEKVYRDADLMEGPYLIGLYLAHVFWANHFEQFLFFRECFMPRLPQSGRLLDIGAGAGTYVVAVRAGRPELAILANDISPHSIAMVRELDRASAPAGVAALELLEGDFIQLLREPGERFDAAIFSEVVEHIPDPDVGLQRLAAAVKPGAPIFFSTATNAAFYDHTLVFHDVAEIEALLARHRFSVAVSRQTPLFQGKQAVEALDYFAVLICPGGHV